MRNMLKISPGEKFGRLIVMGEVNHKGRPKCFCLCECGNVSTSQSSSLRNGDVKSCGCYRNEMVTKARKTHGMTGTRTYRIWRNMQTRCNNPNYTEAHLYGGRGIKVCERWEESFENFLEDMGACPEGMSIDRVNNDGNYEPSNCKWSTPVEQARNRRKPKQKACLKVSYKGSSYTISELSKFLGVNGNALRRRMAAGAPLDQRLNARKSL